MKVRGMKSALPRKLFTQTTLEQWTLLIAIVTFAFLLRIKNIEFGLPHFFHNDEIYKLRDINHFLSGNLHPIKWHHPTFLTYSSALIVACAEAISGTTLIDYERLLISRIWIAFLGSMTVLVVFFVGRYWHSSTLGLISALFLAILPLHVLCSHYLKECVPLVFWMAIALGFFLRFVREKKMYLAVLSGIFTGFATATKYFGLSLLLIFLIALLFLSGSKVWQRKKTIVLGLFIFSLLVGFLAFMPYSVLDFQKFQDGFRYDLHRARRGHERQPIYPWRYVWTFHIQKSIIPGATLPLFILFLAGLGCALRSDGNETKLLAIYWLVLYFLIESSPLKPPPNYERYVLPLFPVLVLFAGYMIVYLYARISPGAIKYSAIFLLILVSYFPLRQTILMDSAMNPDTRETSAFWIAQIIPLDSNLLIVGRDAYLPYVRELGRPAISGSEDCKEFLEPGFLKQFDYIVVSSFLYERHLELYNRKEEPYYFYTYLFNNWKLLKEFPRPRYSMGFNNPTIRIYYRDEDVQNRRVLTTNNSKPPVSP